MSVIKRVEEAYLGVLRFIIILAATLMLLSSVVFMILAVNNWRDQKSGAAEANVAVSPEDVTRDVLSLHAKPPAETRSAAPGRGQTLATPKPNQAEFERAAAAIVAFVQKYGQGVQTLDQERVIPVLQKRAEPYVDTEDARLFAQGLALAMEKSLNDPKVVKLIEPQAAPQAIPEPAASEPEDGADDNAPRQAPQARGFKVSPIDVLNNALEVYATSFEKRVKAREEAKADAAADEARRRATAMTQLYFAGGIFGSFLFLVFISIVVKIERNLRALTFAPVAVRRDPPDL